MIMKKGRLTVKYDYVCGVIVKKTMPEDCLFKSTCKDYRTDACHAFCGPYIELYGNEKRIETPKVKICGYDLTSVI